MTEPQKRCFKCHEVKPLSEFYRHRGMVDGHLNKCKECTKRDVAINRRTSPRAREYDIMRAKLPHRKALRRRVLRRWRNSQNMRAHNAVTRALRNGDLVKPRRCEDCGKETKLHAHHEYYDKSLDVKWLCPACHGKYHPYYVEDVT